MTTREMYVLPTYDQRKFLLPREIATVVLAIMPLFINIGYATHVNGRLTSYADFADVALGLILVFASFGNFTAIMTSETRFKAVRLAVSALLFVAAAAYIASGGGMLVR